MSYSSTILAESGLIAYWELQETTGTSASDASGHGSAGTYTGGVTLGQTGPFSGSTSIKLNGSSGYVSIAESPTLANITTSYSVEGWVKILNGTTGWGIVGGHGIAGLNPEFMVGVYSGQYKLTNYNANLDTLFSGPFSDTNWHHVVATFDSTNGIFLYLDGTLIHSQTTNISSYYSARTGSTSNPFIAALGLGEGANGYTNGYLAHVSVYNKALTQTQVTNHYSAATSSSGTANNVTLSDSVATSDTIALVRNRNLSFSDSIATSDTLSLVQTLHVAISDSITSSDTIANAVGHVLAFSDSVTLSDSLTTAQAHAYALSFSDGITTSDSDTKAASESLHDAIAATDAMAQVRTYFRNYADTIATSDSLTKQMAHVLAFSDGVTVTDAVTAQKVTVYSINLSDSVSVTDAITSLNRILSIALSDSVGTSDSVTMTGGKILNPIRGSIQLLASLDNKITLLASLDNQISLQAGVPPMAQTSQNFTLEQFSSDVLTFTYGGDLSGCTLEWIMQYNVNSLSPLIKKTSANGISITSTSSSSSTFTVSITNTDMSNIGQGAYYHQASVVDALSESNPISKGTVTVSAASNN